MNLSLTTQFGSLMAGQQQEAFATTEQPLPPIEGKVPSPVTNASPSSREGQESSPSVEADISCAADGKSCAISAAQLEGIRARALPLLREGINHGFARFPVQREALVRKLLGTFFQPEIILSTLNPSIVPTKVETPALVQKYRNDSMEAEEAERRGVIVRRIPLQVGKCDEQMIHRNPQVYQGIQSCNELTDIVRGGQPAAAFYMADLEAHLAQKAIDDHRNVPQFIKYANEGPITCFSGTSFHRIESVIDFSLGLQEMSGNLWSAWHMLDAVDGCTTAEGNKTLTADDLQFSFGQRAFVGVQVAFGSAPTVPRTLIVTLSATKGNVENANDQSALVNLAAKVATSVAGSQIEDKARKGFTAAEAAKKYFLSLQPMH